MKESKMELVFYFDVVCPYAYLASERIEAIAAKHGARLTWRPVLLGGIFRAIGAADQPMTQMPVAKARLNLLDMLRYAAFYGVELRLPPEHPRRSVEAMRLCHAVPAEEIPRMAHALYRAYFVDGRNISDRAVLAEVIQRAGFADEVIARVDDANVKDALRTATQEAVDAGAFGVPSFVVGEARTLFWGQDRLTLVERVLGGWQVPL